MSHVSEIHRLGCQHASYLKQLLLSVFETSCIADTLYDSSLDSPEADHAKYLAISPCQACFSFHATPCRCNKYLYCDILCQVRNYLLLCVKSYSLIFNQFGKAFSLEFSSALDKVSAQITSSINFFK